MSEQDKARVAVITGASSGIGKATAKALAAQGWHVIGQGRDPGRTAEAEAEIRAAAAPGARVDMIRGDLSLLADAARMAREIAALTPRVHALLCNAGGVRADKAITAEGNEATFAGNHLGHFLLANRLLPQLRDAARTSPPGTARIVSVSSLAHERSGPIDWNDPQMLADWASGPAYCSVKLCNILFTRELAKRLAGDGIVANAMHPGVVDSNFASHGDTQLQAYMATQAMISPDDAADTLIWLASAPEAGRTSGDYFFQRQAIPTSAAAQDDAAAARLWEESEKLVARAGV